MKILWKDGRVEIAHDDADAQRSTITVYGRRIRYGQEVPPEINWSAIGVVSVAEAKQFAEALFTAIEIAEEVEEINAQPVVTVYFEVPNA